MATITVEHDADADRYLARLDGRVIGEADYQDTDAGRVFVHTGIEPAEEHHGYAHELIREALEDTRRAGRTPIGQCPMVAAYLDEHPDLAEPVR